MTDRFPHLRAVLYHQPWAIMEGRLEAIAEVLERRIEGIRLSPDEVAAIRGDRGPNGTVEIYGVSAGDVVEARSAARSDTGTGQGGTAIAVISLSGIIAQHASQVDGISGPGGTSTERVGASFDAAMADPAVAGIVLNVNSGGGNVHGVQALADKIRAARGTKPIVAQVNSLAASAAYWIACAADEIVMTPGAQAGSIGVYALHKDVSVAAEKEGIKFTFISAGKYKVEGHPYEPLQDDAAKASQTMVDAYYRDFVKAVATGRSVSVDDVRDGFGEGRVLKDADAVKAGLADRVGTLDDTLRRVAKASRSTAPKADDIAPAPLAEAAPTTPSAGSIEADAAKAAQDAAQRDAFRRRRHAYRTRTAG